MKNKFKQFKEAITNPPPYRLAEIEYKSHFLQMIGIAVVCIFLILKGFWYIIFAFIFGEGISYSQGMTAYRKYKAIKEFSDEEKPEDFEKDISPSRRRSKITTFVFGNWAKWISIILSVVVAYIFIPLTLNRWLLMGIYPVSILAGFILFYYYLFYWAAYPMYKGRLKK